MKQKTVGVRDLKTNLSSYLQDVKAGGTIVITDRGKPVGRIMPVEESLTERLHFLSRTSKYSWSGKKPKASKPVKTNKGAKTLVSDIVLENRD